MDEVLGNYLHDPSFKSQDLNRQFSALLKAFSGYAISEGVHVTPYTSEDVPVFSSLPIEEKKGILSNFKSYFLSCMLTLAKVRTLKENLNHLELALTHLGRSIDDSVKTEINDNDVLEIYDIESVQIFRSINFFKLVSYSLDEVFCLPWFELYKRDHFTNKANVDAMRKILSGKYKGPYFPQIPIHKVHEARCQSNYSTTIKHRFMATSYDSYGQVNGIINAFQVLDHSR